ncbi:MFS transporter [Arsenicicoccus piscis]|uniref:Major facilitator superfamily (MFS) profile domain-containing protein n=1 Tax=Arsenicicoccus piscis TaxID=673954 RepID=A0ABQ6HWF8_9MICO|nr:MFS transporter [Arsenicicoccus piscis]MCH8629299.1 MFS transporter [Arsenicicoccus piscis]GMA19739.1 hypothetical protein GCM10025862_17600 [Arsenicicoccus piscis]GMA22034.1 hypothetical protein GCM10025862_40550 [Arsenicicoccus piscis]
MTTAAQTTPSPTREAMHRRRPNVAVLTTVLALTGTIVALQQTLVVPVLPELPMLLHASPDDVSWAVTATLLTSAVATPIVSRAADMFGKRRMMLLCLTVQLIGSVVGALTTSLAGVIAGRSLQGFAAALIPVGISIMRDELPRERVGGAVALMSATLGIGSAVGLPLSGLIYAHMDWHALFWVSAAMATLMLVVIPLVVPESRVRNPGRFDLVGAALLSGALVTLLLAITKGGTWGWLSETVLLLLLSSAVLLAVFVPWELRASTPMVDLRTAARRPVLLTNLASISIGFAMYGNMLSTTELLQMPVATGYGLGLSVLAAGICMLPSGLAMVLLAPVSANITRRFGGRSTLIVGALVLAAGYVLRVFLTDSLWQIVLGATVVSAGTAIAYAAMPTLIMSAVPITETASANGLNSLLRAVGTSTASAMVASVLTSMVMHLGGHSLPTLDAFKAIFWICTAGALLGALLAAFIPARREAASAAGAAAPAGVARDEVPDELVLSGRVHTDTKRAVRNAVVTVLTLDGDPVDWSRVEPDGSYAIVLPGPGRYVRITAADGWAPVSEVVEIDSAASQPVDLGGRLSLRGQVTQDRDGDTVPAVGVLVVLTRATGERVATSRTDADGAFELPLGEHGRHVVSAVDPATAASAAQNVTLVGVEREVDLHLVADPQLVRA